MSGQYELPEGMAITDMTPELCSELFPSSTTGEYWDPEQGRIYEDYLDCMDDARFYALRRKTKMWQIAAVAGGALALGVGIAVGRMTR